MRTFSPKYIVVVIVLCVLTALISPLSSMIINAVLSDNKHLIYCVLLSSLISMLLWIKMDILKQVAINSSLAGLTATIFCLSVSYLFGYILHDIYWFSVCVVMALLAACWWIAGTEMMKNILGPSLLLILMVPLPAGYRNVLAGIVRQIVSYVCIMLAAWMHIPVMLKDNELLFPWGVFTLDAQSLSLEYFIVLITVSVAYGYLKNWKTGRMLVLAALSVPIAMLAVLGRIGVLVAMAEMLGNKVIEGPFVLFIIGMVSWGCALCAVVLASRMIVKNVTCE